MSIVEPFRASFYSEKAGDIKDLVCPPYDVISKSYEKELRGRAAHNFVHMELKMPDETYEDMADKLRKWSSAGLLATDNDPVFYLLRQKFSIKGIEYIRKGIFAQLKLTGGHSICAHEKTHEGPKEDRMNMLRFMKANISPNFVIYQNKEGEPASQLLLKYESSEPFMSVYDEHEKVQYDMWRIHDSVDIDSVKKYFENVELMIADGHHRTEVATKYFLQEKKEDPRYNYMMTYLSPVDDGLVVFPTHRVLHRKFDPADMLNKVSDIFEVEEYRDISEMAAAVAARQKYAFGFAQDGKYLCCTLKCTSVLDKVFASEEEKPYKAIDSFLLHKLVIEKTLGIVTREGDLSYTIDEKEAEKIALEIGGSVFLMKSTCVEEVMKVSVSGFTMPQKTTYFFPKLLSGLLIRQHELQEVAF